MPSEVPDKFVVAKEPKKPRKPPEPSPFKVYPSMSTSAPVAFVRISHFDDWKQRYVVEGRVRTQFGIRKKWEEVAWFTRVGSWDVRKDIVCDWLERLEDTIHDEAVRYARRALEWVNSGKSIRDLHWAMAKENGTLPKADMPLSQEEVKYD